MKSLKKVHGKKLAWVQTGYQGTDYRLVHKDLVLGALHCEEISGIYAIAEARDEKWSFQCTRSVIPRVTIRTNRVNWVGYYEGLRSGEGSYEHFDGSRFSWAPSNSQQTEWGFFNQDQDLVIGFSPEYGWTKTEAIVRVRPKSHTGVPIGLLIFFGWYLILLESELRV